MGDSLFNVGLYVFDNFILAILGIFCADIGSDSETGRHRHAQLIHFSEVGTFTAEDVTHRSIPFSLAVAECKDFFHLGL